MKDQIKWFDNLVFELDGHDRQIERQKQYLESLDNGATTEDDVPNSASDNV